MTRLLSVVVLVVLLAPTTAAAQDLPPGASASEQPAAGEEDLPGDPVIPRPRTTPALSTAADPAGTGQLVGLPSRSKP